MMRIKLIALFAALLFTSPAWAVSGLTQITVKDSGGTARSFNVYSDTGAITGNLMWNHVQCDFTTTTQCQTVNSNNSALIDANTSSQLHSDLTAALPAGTNQIGTVGILDANSNRLLVDPCQSVAKTTTAISQTTTTRLITGTSAKKTYICSMLVMANAAETVSVIEGTTTTTPCDTGATALVANATVSNGAALAANGGFGSGGGGYASIVAGAANADHVCLMQVGSTRLSGYVTWVQQ